MGKLVEKLSQKKILLGDGAWGTLLIESGLQAGGCPEAWNIEFPEKVLAVAAQYIEAGSDIIETNSFGGSRFKLKQYGLENKTRAINGEAARISRQAAGNNHIVLGSVGPTGKILMMGDVSRDEMYEAFREQVMALEEGGADALIIETMSDMDEALIAARAARENTQCDVVVSFTYDRSGDDFHTMMGVTPREMSDTFSAEGFSFAGSNCGNGMHDMVELAKQFKKNNGYPPFMIQANAGKPLYSDGKTVFPESPQEMNTQIIDLLELGVSIIGGCCGTTPAHIREFRKTIDAFLK